MTLSRWLRDYLYIPLGGNRDGVRRTYRNLFLTMLLGGLWHGAAMTFIVWGAIHGGFLCLERVVRERWRVLYPEPVLPAAASLFLRWLLRSEEHTSELQSLMRISYAVFCLKKKKIS